MARNLMRFLVPMRPLLLALIVCNKIAILANLDRYVTWRGLVSYMK